jgi:hypothetical protein
VAGNCKPHVNVRDSILIMDVGDAFEPKLHRAAKPETLAAE